MTNSPDLNEITVNTAILRVHIKDVKAQVIYEFSKSHHRRCIRNTTPYYCIYCSSQYTSKNVMIWIC